MGIVRLSAFQLRRRLCDFLGFRGSVLQTASVLHLVLALVHNNLVSLSDLQLTVKLFKPCGLFGKFLGVFKGLTLCGKCFLQICLCSCQLFLQLREPSVKALAEQIFKAGNVAYVARNINLGCIGELVAERNATTDGKAVVDFLKRKLKSELEQKLHKQQRKHKEIGTIFFFRKYRF